MGTFALSRVRKEVVHAVPRPWWLVTHASEGKIETQLPHLTFGSPQQSQSVAKQRLRQQACKPVPRQACKPFKIMAGKGPSCQLQTGDCRLAAACSLWLLSAADRQLQEAGGVGGDLVTRFDFFWISPIRVTCSARGRKLGF